MTFSRVERYVADVVAGLRVGTVSVWYGGLTGPATYTRNEAVSHYAASTMKLPLAVAAYRLAERGELDLDAEVLVHNEFRSAADGSPFAMEQDDDQDDETWGLIGDRCSLRQLVRHAIVRSGNLATNLVWEQVGAGEIAQVLVDAGCSGNTVVRRGIEDTAARESGIDNLVTAADLALVMRGVAARTLGSPDSCAEVEHVLSLQEHRDKIVAGLPADCYVANKTGWVNGVAHDVALVRPEAGGAFVLAVCTTLDVPEPDANDLVAGIAGRIWETRAP